MASRDPFSGIDRCNTWLVKENAKQNSRIMNGHPPKARVLLVDDEPAVCEILGQELTGEGFSCDARYDADSALALLAREPFDIVVSDLRMPGKSGLELLGEVRKKYPHAAFLMVTGVDDVRVGIEAMKKGAADYLVKPVDGEGLLASVERALEVRRMGVELEDYRRNLEQMVQDRTKQLETARRRIELTYDETLEALGAALDLRDTETAGHSQRVTRYCLEMARALGCSADLWKQISRGSYLHDIGKIGIPDAILLKEGKLTAEETEVMQAHVRIGYELVSRIAFLAGAAEIVLTHQERFDGTGYPQGLVGEEIPVGARVFAVADTLDAMTSDRPYRRALPFSAAKEEIIRESGRQFDPKVVEAFLSTPEETFDRIRDDVASIRSQPRGISLIVRHRQKASGR